MRPWRLLEFSMLTAKQRDVCAGEFSGLRSTWPSIFIRDVITLLDNGLVSHRSYSVLFEITLRGHLMLRMERRCLRWQMLSFSMMFLGAAQQLELYINTDTTWASYICSFRSREILLPFIQTFLKLLKATLARFIL